MCNQMHGAANLLSFGSLCVQEEWLKVEASTSTANGILTERQKVESQQAWGHDPNSPSRIWEDKPISRWVWPVIVLGSFGLSFWLEVADLDKRLVTVQESTQVLEDGIYDQVQQLGRPSRLDLRGGGRRGGNVLNGF